MDAFSEKSGISKSYISLLEKNKHPKTGKSIAPSIQCMKQAAFGMDIDFNNLFSMLDGNISKDTFSLSSLEKDIIRKFRTLKNGERAMFLRTIGIEDTQKGAKCYDKSISCNHS